MRKNNNITHYIGDIYADDFLIELAKELDCFPPELFSNPYNFLNQQLETVQPYPLGDGLDILENLTTYLNEQSEKSLTTTLYTAFIHKYPNKESIDGLNEHEIDQIMWAYDKQARILFDADCINDSFNLYEQAFKINSNHSGCLHNYGYALLTIGSKNDDAILVEKSVEHLKNLFDKEPNSLTIYAVSLLELAKQKNEKILFDEVFSLLNQLLVKNPNDTYNLACYYAITKNIQLSLDNLIHAEKHGTLPQPSYNHLSEDKDLDNIRKEQQFIELLERLKAKEAADNLT